MTNLRVKITSLTVKALPGSIKSSAYSLGGGGGGKEAGLLHR